MSTTLLCLQKLCRHGGSRVCRGGRLVVTYVRRHGGSCVHAGGSCIRAGGSRKCGGGSRKCQVVVMYVVVVSIVVASVVVVSIVVVSVVVVDLAH